MIHRAAVVVLALFATAASAEDIPNPLIDYAAFQAQVIGVNALRNSRRVSEADFIAMSRDPKTVVLDARSAEKFALLHIRGAKNLSFPDMTEDDLARVIPTKDTRILIYCNNNFLNDPVAFRSKVAPASLNLYTYNALTSYGYTNVYELGPLIDIGKSKLKFAGSRAK